MNQIKRAKELLLGLTIDEKIKNQVNAIVDNFIGDRISEKTTLKIISEISAYLQTLVFDDQIIDFYIKNRWMNPESSNTSDVTIFYRIDYEVEDDSFSYDSEMYEINLNLRR